MAAFIRRYFALTMKEVQQLRRNRVLLIQLMLPPTIVLIIFGYALNPKVRDLRLGVVDQSMTSESQGFIDFLAQNVNFKVTNRYIRTQEAEDPLRSPHLHVFRADGEHKYDSRKPGLHRLSGTECEFQGDESIYAHAECGRRAQKPGPGCIHCHSNRFRAHSGPWTNGRCTGSDRCSGRQYRADCSGLPANGFGGLQLQRWRWWRRSARQVSRGAHARTLGPSKPTTRRTGRAACLSLQSRPRDVVALRDGCHEHHHVYQRVARCLGPASQGKGEGHNGDVVV